MMQLKEFISTFVFGALTKGEPSYNISIESISEEYKKSIF